MEISMATKQPNVIGEAGKGPRFKNEDPQHPQSDKQAYYSASNPFGVYGAYRSRPDGAKGQQYLEGFSTQVNVDKWSQYAARNSGPKVAPGTGNKSRGR
jgi:hypothetical protein